MAFVEQGIVDDIVADSGSVADIVHIVDIDNMTVVHLDVNSADYGCD